MPQKKISWISLLAYFGAVGVPVLSVVLFAFSCKNYQQRFFIVFICFHSVERVWETFFTSKERHPFELHGDWTLIATTVAYIALCLLSSAECFIAQESPPVFPVILGVILFLMAFSLRWWGMRTLGNQWAVHAVGAQKVSKASIVKDGPYHYIRHPIYLAIFFEVLSIPLIANAFWGLLFAAFLYIPLQYKRLREEEKNNVRKMGEAYLHYMGETSSLIPIKRFFSRNRRSQ
ncbi:MAG: isoprenylcysteine carboxylmethyltransferase family protein [Candidatus Omnitrophota bacterium]